MDLEQSIVFLNMVYLKLASWFFNLHLKLNKTQLYKMRKYYFIVAVILLLGMFPNVIDAQCAMCKASVESSQGQKNSVAGGINQGILYLMAVPYILIAFVFRKQIVALWKSFRGKKMVEDEL